MSHPNQQPEILEEMRLPGIEHIGGLALNVREVQFERPEGVVSDAVLRMRALQQAKALEAYQPKRSHVHGFVKNPGDYL